MPLLAAARQFPFGHPAVSAVVVGARAPSEIADTASLLSHPIPAELWPALERAGLLPAHG